MRRGAEQVEERAGCVVAAAAVAELGDFVDAAAGLGRRGDLAGEGRVEALFFAFWFAVGGVGQHVDADGECVGDVLDDLGRVVVPLAGAGKFPVARQVLVAVDDTRAAAVFHAVQVPGVGRIGPNHVLHPPHGVAGWNGLQFVFGFGEDGGHQLAQGGVEAARIAATCFGEDEAAAIDVVA